MLRNIFFSACVAAGAIAIAGCTDQAAIDKQKAAEAQTARLETLEIVKFLEERFPLSEIRIPLTNIPAERKAAMVRFVKLSERMQKSTDRYSAVMADLQKMEPAYGMEDEPRIGRLEFIHQIGEQNTTADKALNALQIILMDNAQNLNERHIAAFRSCAYTATHRSSIPTQTKAELDRAYPSGLMEKAYPDERGKVDNAYTAAVDIQDTLQLGLFNTGFADLNAYQPDIDRFEAGISVFEQEVDHFAQAMRPVVAELKSSFAQMRHKSLLLQVNTENCAVAITDFHAREGAFSDVPIPAKPEPGPSI